MSTMINSLSLKHGFSLWCPHSALLNRIPRSSSVAFANFPRSYVVASSAFANENREFIIVGGGNAAGYAAWSFVVVCKEAVAPFERPTLTKGYLFALDKKPARLPGFHTYVGSGGESQTPDWYKEHGIEMLYEDPVTGLDIEKKMLTMSSDFQIKLEGTYPVFTISVMLLMLIH